MDFKGLISRRNLIGFHVQSLPEVAGGFFSQSSFGSHVGRDQDLLSISELKDA